MTHIASANTNGLKARLRAPAGLCGMFVGLPSPAMVEMIGHAGFDFVIIDMEHGPASTETLEHLLRAAAACGVAALVRVASGASADILHALDAGAEAILVPHVRSAADAAAIVGHAHYPPLGHRGISGLTRAARYGFAADHLRASTAKTTVVVMIEDEDALPNVSGIAATEGVDAVFIGPADLAGSMGLPGQPTHPTVLAAVARIIDDVRGAGVQGAAVLATTARDAADGLRLHAAGFGMVCFNAVSLFRDGLRLLHAGMTPTDLVGLPDKEPHSMPVRVQS